MERESLPNLFRRLDARNRENVAHAGLNIRTSADIFEECQRQYETARAERSARPALRELTRRPDEARDSSARNAGARPGDLFRCFQTARNEGEQAGANENPFLRETRGSLPADFGDHDAHDRPSTVLTGLGIRSQQKISKPRGGSARRQGQRETRLGEGLSMLRR